MSKKHCSLDCVNTGFGPAADSGNYLHGSVSTLFLSIKLP